MSPFLAGLSGALAALFVVGALRRLAWSRRLRRWRGGRAGVHPFMLRRLFRRIDAKPEQEAVLTAEADALAVALQALRGDARALRADVADLLAGPALDAARVREALDARLAGLETVRARAALALATVHATLEPGQREALAALVRYGPHGRRRRVGS